MITKGKEKYEIIDQITIEGFQNFAQYEKINPAEIQLTDSELKSKLLYFPKKINTDFWLIIYYLVLQLKTISIQFLLQQMD